jgi:hypothetical protein
MPVTYTKILYPESYDLTETRASDVQFGFVVELPFRLRVGTWYSHEITARGKRFTIWLLNRVAVSDEHASGFEALKPGGTASDLWTEALLVLHDTDFAEEAVASLRVSAREGREPEYLRPEAERFDAMEALNHFVVGYATATGQLYGGSRLRLLQPLEFHHYLRWDLTLILPDGTAIGEDYARSLFDLQPTVTVVTGESILGDLDDLPPAQLAAVGRAIQRHQDHLFYEFAFDAKAKKTAGDNVGALLMAVAAYETVHGAYVHRLVMERLPAGSSQRLSGDYLRELGMMLCNKLTPYLLMPPDARPDPRPHRTGRGGVAHSERDHARASEQARGLSTPPAVDRGSVRRVSGDRRAVRGLSKRIRGATAPGRRASRDG